MTTVLCRRPTGASTSPAQGYAEKAKLQLLQLYFPPRMFPARETHGQALLTMAAINRISGDTDVRLATILAPTTMLDELRSSHNTERTQAQVISRWDNYSALKRQSFGLQEA